MTTIRKNKGFTLSELVMVIVILGILAAFALPRFADVGSDAREASRQGFVGAMRSASAITYAACAASSGCDVSAATSAVALQGENIDTVFGYPEATAAGIGAAAQIDGVIGVPDATATPPTFTITLATDCTVVYTQAAAAGSAPTFGGDDSGC